MNDLFGIVIAGTWLLLAASIAKLIKPNYTTIALRSAGIPVTNWLIRVGALSELAICAGVLIPFNHKAGVAFLMLMAISYLGLGAFVAIAIVRDIPLSSCGCFGEVDSPPTVLHVIINCLYALAIGIYALDTHGKSVFRISAGTGWSGAAVIATSLVIAYLSYLALTELPRLLAVRRTIDSVK